jgi:hypothetical protein
MARKEILWTVGITLATMAIVSRVAFLRNNVLGH